MQQNHSRRRRGRGERVLGLRRHEAREASGLASDRGKVCPVGEQIQQVRRFGAVKRQLQSPLARRDGDLPLPKLFTGAILASKPAGYLANVGRKGVRRSMKERASGRTEIF
jgi:hypothetical protein